MKTAAYSLLALPGLLLFHYGQFTIAPSDFQAAVVWNLGLMLAPVLALVFQWKFAKERHIPIAIFLSVWAVVNAALVLGSRAGALTSADWYQVLIGGGLPVLPGKTVMGGMLLAMVVFVALRRWWRISFHIADAIVLGLPLAGIIVRIGCLYAGCCFGVPTGAAHGICYGPGSPAFTQQVNAGLLASDASSSLPVYPIQAILIIGNLLIFCLLWHSRKTITRPGALGFLGLALLTLQRFGIEFFRDIATNRGQFGVMWEGLKMAQWACLFIAAIGVAGFLLIQFGKARAGNHHTSASVKQQAMVIGCIALGVLLLQEVLSLDETVAILLSCLPAIYVLGQLLWRAHLSGQKVLAPTIMLSATTLALIVTPLDSIAPTIIKRQWLEVGTGGALGNYQNITRDCGGNVVDRDKINYGSGGLEISSNWQRNNLNLKAGLRGAFGKSHPQDAYLPEFDYRYSSFGLYGKVSFDWIGFSLGGFSREKRLESGLKETSFVPSASIRFGPVHKYSFDIRAFDEPTFGFSNEPVVSIGLVNWGFKDHSGSKFLRFGFAAISNQEFMWHFSGGYPFGKSGLSGSLAAYLGNGAMVHWGLRYRFNDRQRR
jgi:prolipoprotein diacylglyceryltransferase